MTRPEQWQTYIETLRQRDHADKERIQRRYERAWCLVGQAAEVLRRDFGATRVVVFGSLLRPSTFGEQSDVDLAAWGIQPQDTLRAMSAVAYLDEQIEVNLVDVNTCKPSVLQVIASEGVDV
ncbi:MAG: nucleotidyltransferase domain-containing protein [Armatimonadota bacterium]|nr:nucleotidyltransferase domain-containing protein [bacterium]MDW8320504.1 nucleotidyltransferase domain-containing protein [Armatimonadota bacterium]